MFKKHNRWLLYSLTTTILWGIWGALMEIPEKEGFPATLGYVVWALTMIPCALVALRVTHWKFEHDIKSVLFGMLAGLLGSGGTVLLFQALKSGPAFLIFPVISLSPLINILLSILFFREKVSTRSRIGVVLAVLSIPLLTHMPKQAVNQEYAWVWLALIIFLMWGTQAWVIKLANRFMKAESIFFYMMCSAVLLIPFSIMATDFTQFINWSFEGPYLTALIQFLNAMGALSMVYAFRYGNSIIVSPLINAIAPVITIIISLLIYAVIPPQIKIAGMSIAVIAVILMAE